MRVWIRTTALLAFAFVLLGCDDCCGPSSTEAPEVPRIIKPDTTATADSTDCAPPGPPCPGIPPGQGKKGK